MRQYVLILGFGSQSLKKMNIIATNCIYRVKSFIFLRANNCLFMSTTGFMNGLFTMTIDKVQTVCEELCRISMFFFNELYSRFASQIVTEL